MHLYVSSGSSIIIYPPACFSALHSMQHYLYHHKLLYISLVPRPPPFLPSVCTASLVKIWIGYYKSHATSEHAMKSEVCIIMIKIYYHCGTKLYQSLICCCGHCYSCCTTVQMVTNLCMIFFSVALYYGDIYISSP